MEMFRECGWPAFVVLALAMVAVLLGMVALGVAIARPRAGLILGVVALATSCSVAAMGAGGHGHRQERHRPSVVRGRREPGAARARSAWWVMRKRGNAPVSARASALCRWFWQRLPLVWGCCARSLRSLSSRRRPWATVSVPSPAADILVAWSSAARRWGRARWRPRRVSARDRSEAPNSTAEGPVPARGSGGESSRDRSGCATSRSPSDSVRQRVGSNAPPGLCNSRGTSASRPAPRWVRPSLRRCTTRAMNTRTRR